LKIVRVAVTPGNQAGLTARQREILLRVAAGRSDKQIAVDLGIANSTVQRHLTNIYLKLGAGNRIEALRQAVALGALPPDSLER
jgi:DNA-binding CsgD family transcriptional regulator